ncbi:MAG: molybdopterin-dependent oxidoreductase [Bryobacteraceae bacterium]|nr:molybdopterin-dependent oxidoreductase [Bryobacteraceae bacterium]
MRTRRDLLMLAPAAALSPFAIPAWQKTLLSKAQQANDTAAAYFHSARLAPEFSRASLTPLARFPHNSYLTDDPGVDLATWRFTVEGQVKKPGAYSLDDLRALPKRVQVTRHICIEGWAVIGSFGGVPLGAFLRHVGAAPDARFVEVECEDDYYESIDIATALHPQTLLCYEMYGAPLTSGHGAPLRLQMPTKLGYKQAKYVNKLRVSQVLSAKRGYWVDQGYPWYGGI